jgi:sulfur carrier protein ThiS
MKVFIQKTGIEAEHEAATARELLAALGVAPDTVLIVKDGVLVTEDADLAGAERVELLSVISGG